MKMPALSAGPYHPSARPTYPPRMAPTMPSSIVTMMPPGSFPGINSLAIAPTISPKTIHPRMPNMQTPPDEVLHNVCQLSSKARIDDRVEDRPECVCQPDTQVVLIAAPQPAQAQQHFLRRDASARNRQLVPQPAGRALDRK